MLQLRARAFALRDKFADALRGLRQAEVEMDEGEIIEGEVVSNAALENKQVDKLKNILKSNAAPAAAPKEPVKEKKQEKAPEDNTPISDDNILEIQRLMEEKNFDDVRKLKALDYFKVSKLVELTNGQAKVFLLQLSKA